MSDVGIAQRYTTEVSDRYGYLATWWPSIRLTLGTLGVLGKGRVFDPQGTLADEFGVAFSPVASPAIADFSSQSASGCEWHVKLAGKSDVLAPHLPLAAAGIGMRFSDEGSLFFQLGGTTYERIENQIALRRDLLRLASEGRWHRDWLVVTELIRAQTAVILVSGSAGAAAELTIDARVASPGLEALTAGAGVCLLHSQSLHTKIIAASDLTPLFGAVRIRRQWFSGVTKVAPAFASAAEAVRAAPDVDEPGVFQSLSSYSHLEGDD